MTYERGTVPILPHDQLDPDIVRKTVAVAVALIGPTKFLEAVDYSFKTLRRIESGDPTSTSRVRTDFLVCSRAVIHEQRQTLFDMAAVEPINLPETVFPYRMTKMIKVPVNYQFNLRNPYSPLPEDRSLPHYLWLCFYMSVRPGNHGLIHLYGNPLKCCRLRIDQMKGPDRSHLHQLLHGPSGNINRGSVIANPTLLSYFAQKVRLEWNVWGNALVDGLADVDSTP